MGAMRKKLVPLLSSGAVRPTAPVSKNASFLTVASRAAAAEMALPWLPSTMEAPRRARLSMASGTASARAASTSASLMRVPSTTLASLAQSVASWTPRSSSVPPGPCGPVRGYRAPTVIVLDVSLHAASAVPTTAVTRAAKKRRRIIQSTTRRLARTWVMAGTFHEPVAHRCHDRTKPAARSMGRTHQP